jgi:leucyl/phenylalanyl-tRNA--protein transferase
MNHRSRGTGLDPEFVLEAYIAGFFPMADPQTGEISWYSPDPRAVLPFSRFHIPRSLKSVLRRDHFQIRFNTAFEEVVRGCAGREETWISDEVRQVFVSLHAKGFAHSIETWQSGKLAGGLYGLAIRGAFFGESMFSLVPNASKVALVELVERLTMKKFDLLDVQFMTSHLAMFGAIEIPRSAYMKTLAKAISSRCTFL